jgi:hypothetical protein
LKRGRQSNNFRDDFFTQTHTTGESKQKTVFLKCKTCETADFTSKRLDLLLKHITKQHPDSLKSLEPMTYTFSYKKINFNPLVAFLQAHHIPPANSPILLLNKDPQLVGNIPNLPYIKSTSYAITQAEQSRSQTQTQTSPSSPSSPLSPSLSQSQSPLLSPVSKRPRYNSPTHSISSASSSHTQIPSHTFSHFLPHSLKSDVRVRISLFSSQRCGAIKKMLSSTSIEMMRVMDGGYYQDIPVKVGENLMNTVYFFHIFL